MVVGRVPRAVRKRAAATGRTRFKDEKGRAFVRSKQLYLLQRRFGCISFFFFLVVAVRVFVVDLPLFVEWFGFFSGWLPSA